MTRTFRIGLGVGLAALAAALAPGAASADEITYAVQKSAPAAKVGVSANLSLTVVGKNGWHVNEEAPITASLKADPGVALPKVKLTRADLAQSTKQSVRFEIPFSASEAGKKTITAQTRFVMCQEQACKPVNEIVTLQVDVAAKADSPMKPTVKTKPKTATP
jgi:DsbC/DsbD-like thiol-disulfide interchange protein